MCVFLSVLSEIESQLLKGGYSSWWDGWCEEWGSKEKSFRLAKKQVCELL